MVCEGAKAPYTIILKGGVFPEWHSNQGIPLFNNITTFGVMSFYHTASLTEEKQG